MKKKSIRILSAVFVVLMLLTAAPLEGFIGMELFGTKASAESEGYYTFAVSGGKATITDVDESISGNVEIPSTLGGFPVTGIGYSAFGFCYSLTDVTIPDSVTSVGNFAFEHCTGLTSVIIGKGVTSITPGMFEYCTGLASLTVEPGNTKYDSRDNAIVETESNTLILGCKNTVISDSVTSIGSGAFAGCKSLISITFPNSVTNIGANAFFACSNLTSVSLGNSITGIAAYAFANCSELTSITIPESVISIGDYAFAACYSLTDITLPDNLTSVGDCAFFDCLFLKNATILNSECEIGELVFASSIIPIVDAEQFIEYYNKLINLEISGEDSSDYFTENTDENYAIPDFVVYGFKDSTAETYANDIGYTFTAIEEVCIHENTEILNTKPATCTDAGYTGDTVCIDCGETIEKGEAIDALGHNLAEAVVRTSTCLTRGTHYYYCTNENCEYQTNIDFLSIDSANHEGKKELKNVKKATCEEEGYTGDYIWSCCKKVEESGKTVKALGHNFTGEVKANKDGTHSFKCVNGCGKFGATVNCSGGTATCKSLAVCDVCKAEYGDFGAHSYGEWVVTIQSTIRHEGSKEKTCICCGNVVAEAIVKLPSNEKVNSNTGISVSFDDEAFSGKDVTVVVDEKYDGTEYELTSKGLYQPFNISIYSNGDEIQPSTPVLVRIPLPEGFSEKNIKVYHVNEKEDKIETITNVEVVGGYITFMADSFSVYLVQDASKNVEPAINCTCKCHNTKGFVGFFFKIQMFFWKLFKIKKHQFCECGKAHW